MPIWFESQFKLIKDSDYLTQEIGRHSSSFNSTTESYNDGISHSSNENLYSFNECQPSVFYFQRLTNLDLENFYTMNVYNDFNENNKITWPKLDPRPIGTKPASMTNLSYSSMNRNRFNKSSTVYFNSNFKQTLPKLDLAENFKQIWNISQESNTMQKNDGLKSNNIIEHFINKSNYHILLKINLIKDRTLFFNFLKLRRIYKEIKNFQLRLVV